MTYDYELVLISQEFFDSNGKPLTDEDGNPTPVEAEVSILCGKKSVARNEFYKAASEGLKPEYIFVIHSYEYSGEKYVEFENVKYNVIRTYQVNFEELELTCERVIGDG